MTDPSPRVLVLNGPNLNLLGEREPHLYGSTTLAQVEQGLVALAAQLKPGLIVDCRQTNHEGQLIDWIQEGRQTTTGLILNPGGLTHTSVALHDALAAYPPPVVEVHISQPHNREAFRHTSLVTPVAWGTIAGLGVIGYELALRALLTQLK